MPQQACNTNVSTAGFATAGFPQQAFHSKVCYSTLATTRSAQQSLLQQACHNMVATAGFATAGLHNNISTAGFATARLPQQGFYSSTCHSGLGQRCSTSGRTFQSSWPKQIKKSLQHPVAMMVLDQCACFKTCPCFATIACLCHNDTGLDLVSICT